MKTPCWLVENSWNDIKFIEFPYIIKKLKNIERISNGHLGRMDPSNPMKGPETWQTIPKGGYDLSIMGWSNPGATLFSWKIYYGYIILYLYNPLVIIGNHFIYNGFLNRSWGLLPPKQQSQALQLLLLFEVAHFVVSHWWPKPQQWGRYNSCKWYPCDL